MLSRRALGCQLAAVFIFAAASACATDVWIDTDPSIGAPWREVDDGYALVLAFRSPELRIVGMSTTYGNAGLKRTTAVAREIVQRAGATVPVYRGASSPRDMQTSTEATEALARVLRSGRLTYIALGPLTNLASLLHHHPQLASRIERVIFVGGKSPGRALTFGPDDRLRVHDANVFKDPAAVRDVLRSRVPITLAPVEASSELVLARADVRALRGGDASARFLAARSGVWIWFWTNVVREKGGPLFDALAVLAAARPKTIRTETRFASVDDSADLIAARVSTPGARPVRFCTRVEREATSVVMRRLLRD
ncbi:MAG TPA: nucleoside hydrolase [Chthoniobacterales bacterium]